MRRKFVLCLAVVFVGAEERSSTYIKTANNEDLQTSGSGYSYQIHSGQPFAYNTDSTGKFEEGEPATLGRYSHQPLPLHLLPLAPKFLETAAKDAYAKRIPVPYAKGFDNFLDDGSSGAEKFLKESGSDYDEYSSSAKGEKGDSGYSKQDEYAKGSRGEYDKENRKGYYDVSGGKNQDNQLVKGHYDVSYQNGKVNLGGSFSKDKGHDKGSKTTGYRKVFHKDEFKKDHTFYDKADKRGHFNRYGNFDAKQKSEEGSYKKGGKHDKGFEAKGYGVEGYSDKGRFLDEDRRYKGARGNDRFYKIYEDFAKKEGTRKHADSGFKGEDKQI